MIYCNILQYIMGNNTLWNTLSKENTIQFLRTYMLNVGWSEYSTIRSKTMGGMTLCSLNLQGQKEQWWGGFTGVLKCWISNHPAMLNLLRCLYARGKLYLWSNLPCVQSDARRLKDYLNLGLFRSQRKGGWKMSSVSYAWLKQDLSVFLCSHYCLCSKEPGEDILYFSTSPKQIQIQVNQLTDSKPALSGSSIETDILASSDRLKWNSINSFFNPWTGDFGAAVSPC